jgi:hypothetical protein
VVGDDPANPVYCNFLVEAGFECVPIPIGEPVPELDGYDVILATSSQWQGAAERLTDLMRGRKGVITFRAVPAGLGINTNPLVQAWVGANQAWQSDGPMVSTQWDPIMAPHPPGTEVDQCNFFPCEGLRDITGHPSTKVLAVYSWSGGETIGILRNTWQGGQSVYFGGFIGPGWDVHEQIIVNAVRELSRGPVPAVSHWGLAVLALLTLAAGSVVIRGRNRLRVA